FGPPVSRGWRVRPARLRIPGSRVKRLGVSAPDGRIARYVLGVPGGRQAGRSSRSNFGRFESGGRGHAGARRSSRLLANRREEARLSEGAVVVARVGTARLLQTKS